jgi:hypothetical protein
MAIEFPQPQLAALQKLAVRLIDSRKPRSDLDLLARDLLRGFHDVSRYAGLDRVLDELDQADPENLTTKLVAQLTAIDLDGGGPQNAKSKQLVDCVVAALELTIIEEPPDRTISLGDDVRIAVASAISSVVEAELAVPKIRETIISEARARCEERFFMSFDKVAVHLDDRGLTLVKQPKIPIDAMQGVQKALFDARNAIVSRVAQVAIDRAKDAIARTDPAAAERIDQPITERSTPREVAILRATDSRVSKTPSFVTHSLFESLTELARFTWRAAEKPVHQYGASKTFAIGDVIEHPKFGRGSVVGALAGRIDVEFADGKRTLVHVPPK